MVRSSVSKRERKQGKYLNANGTKVITQNWAQFDAVLLAHGFLSTLLIKCYLGFTSQCWWIRGIGWQIIFTWCGYYVVSSLSLWYSFNSVKGTNAILWTCLGLSLIVSLTIFVFMFLLRKMNSEPSKDECKNTGWLNGQTLESISKRWLLWFEFLLFFFPVEVFLWLEPFRAC